MNSTTNVQQQASVHCEVYLVRQGSRKFDSFSGRCHPVTSTTWMGDCLRTSKPSPYRPISTINRQGQLSLPSLRAIADLETTARQRWAL